MMRSNQSCFVCATGTSRDKKTMACCCRLNLCDLPSCVLLHQLQIVNLSSSYSTAAIILPRAQFGLLTIAVLQFLFSLSSAKSSDVTSLLLVTIALRPSFAMPGEAEKGTRQPPPRGIAIITRQWAQLCASK